MTDPRGDLFFGQRSRDHLEHLEAVFRRLQALRISYVLRWCPSCEYRDKAWEPRAGICRGNDYDAHEPKCIRHTCVYEH